MNLTPDHRWSCPNCTVTRITHDPRPHTPFHPCHGLRGLTAPLVAAGSDCVVETRDREDYVGKENVQSDGEGRPVMSIVTRYGDGRNDCAVLAPCATMRSN
jgi:hypothetical protein